MPNFLTSAMSAFRFPRWLSGKESICQCRRCRRHEFNSWVGKILWRRKCQPTPVFLPGKSHGEKSLVSYSPWSHKESDTAKYAHGSVPGEEIKWICSIKKSQNIDQNYFFIREWEWKRGIEEACSCSIYMYFLIVGFFLLMHHLYI